MIQARQNTETLMNKGFRMMNKNFQRTKNILNKPQTIMIKTNHI